jgi:hypothetical protein
MTIICETQCKLQMVTRRCYHHNIQIHGRTRYLVLAKQISVTYIKLHFVQIFVAGVFVEDCSDCT